MACRVLNGYCKNRIVFESTTWLLVLYSFSPAKKTLQVVWSYVISYWIPDLVFQGQIKSKHARLFSSIEKRNDLIFVLHFRICQYTFVCSCLQLCHNTERLVDVLHATKRERLNFLDVRLWLTAWFDSDTRHRARGVILRTKVLFRFIWAVATLRFS